jgi:hypothetical protein
MGTRRAQVLLRRKWSSHKRLEDQPADLGATRLHLTPSYLDRRNLCAPILDSLTVRGVVAFCYHAIDLRAATVAR